MRRIEVTYHDGEKLRTIRAAGALHIEPLGDTCYLRFDDGHKEYLIPVKDVFEIL